MADQLRYIAIRKDDMTVKDFHALVRTWELKFQETEGAYIFAVDNQAVGNDMVKGRYGKATELTMWLGKEGAA
ncbi:hypothetical protein D3C81_442120 [compost metagenome]